jgi:glycosyltransferase involved in cell wall biosynthesis
MVRHRVAIVIPALNEAKTISAVVKAASAFGLCIVVDDGSSDDTAQLAQQAGAAVVSHAVNQGYDAALNSGFAYAAQAGCDIIMTLDADGQHDPSLALQFIQAIDAGADVALGVRSHRARLAEHVFALYTRWRWAISDPLCGMKAYRTSVYRALGHFDSYQSIGTELALFAARGNLRVVQIAFDVRDREDAPRFGKRWAANLKIFRAMWLSFFQTA